MEVVLKRSGKFWRCGAQQLQYGTTYTVPGGWQYTLYQDDKRFGLHVADSNGQRYRCAISSQRQKLLLLDDGVVEPLVLSTKHFRLARLVSTALASRPTQGKECVVARVAFRDAIDGKTFKTVAGPRNNFSDAPSFQILGTASNRTLMQCMGGTYLVRVERHASGVIFAAEVLVQPRYNSHRLVKELSALE